jgi:aspartate ammonia-lyase
MKKLITYFILSCLVAAPVVNAQQTRTEKDLLGEKQIPADVYYGVQTARALENFKLSGIKINHYPGFVEAWAIVKLAAARANTEVGAMKPDRLAAIEIGLVFGGQLFAAVGTLVQDPGAVPVDRAVRLL